MQMSIVCYVTHSLHERASSVGINYFIKSFSDVAATLNHHATCRNRFRRCKTHSGCVCFDRHVHQVRDHRIHHRRFFRVMFMHNEQRAAKLCHYVRVVVLADGLERRHGRNVASREVSADDEQTPNEAKEMRK